MDVLSRVRMAVWVGDGAVSVMLSKRSDVEVERTRENEKEERLSKIRLRGPTHICRRLSPEK